MTDKKLPKGERASPNRGKLPAPKVPQVRGKKGGQTKGSLFQKGQSGNPRGRPKASKSVRTQLVRSILEGEAEVVTKVLLKRAKSGNVKAIELILMRLDPAPRYPKPQPYTLPPIATQQDCVAAMARLAVDVASGTIDKDHAESVREALNDLVKLHEGITLADQVSQLQAQIAEIKKGLAVSC